MHDIVYILREDIKNPDELRYSLRSVAENFPHRKIWFVCGQPEGFYPDGRIAHKQEGKTKWERVRTSLLKVAEYGDITDDFYLFNDDFFVLKKQTEPFTNFVNGTLEKRVRAIQVKSGYSVYSDMLRRTKDLLTFEGVDTMSFAVHLPMLINKQKMKETLERFGSPMFRSIYGNINNVPYIFHEDVKIYDDTKIPELDDDYVSTSDHTWISGAVGRYIRDKFPKPCEYEVPIEERLRKITRERYTEEGDERCHEL